MFTDSASSSHRCDGLQHRRATPSITRALAPAHKRQEAAVLWAGSTAAGSPARGARAASDAAAVPVDARDMRATGGTGPTGRARRRARWMNDTRPERLPVTLVPSAPGPSGRPPARPGCRTPLSYSSNMGRQLVLLDERSPWRLDEASKERGRRGLAAARAALAQAVRRVAA